jgi:hypothetical protein
LLSDYFYSRSVQLLQTSRLLLSRWARFSKTSNSVNQLYSSFANYEENLVKEYAECLERYERLKECLEWKELVDDNDFDYETNTTRNVLLERLVLDLYKSLDEGYKPEDLAVYTRGIITNTSATRHLSYLNCHINHMHIKERAETIDTYAQLSVFLMKSLSDEELEEFGKPGMPRRDYAPRKIWDLFDFIDKFEWLAAEYNLNTDIEIESGRKLAHEVYVLFTNEFRKQTRRAFLDMEIHMKTVNIATEKYSQEPEESKENDEEHHDDDISFPIMKSAQWLEDISVTPRLKPWQERQQAEFKKANEVDFELRYEYDLIRSEKQETMLARIQEKLKIVLEENGVRSGRSNVRLFNNEEEDENDENMNFENTTYRSAAESIAAKVNLIKGNPIETDNFINPEDPQPNDVKRVYDIHIDGWNNL